MSRNMNWLDGGALTLFWRMLLVSTERRGSNNCV